MQGFKGGSSRRLRKEYSELEELLWGDSFWTDGYFSGTAGVVQVKMRKYIRRPEKILKEEHASPPEALG